MVSSFVAGAGADEWNWVSGLNLHRGSHLACCRRRSLLYCRRCEYVEVCEMETDQLNRVAILVFALLQAETLSIDAEMRLVFFNSRQ